MQVTNNYTVYPNSVKPNFKALKSLEFSGKLRKNPWLQEKLLDAFESNKKIMAFCEKFDTKVQFTQYRSDNYVVSKMNVAYDAISKVKMSLGEKIKSMFKSPNVVVVDGFSNLAHNEQTSVDALIDAMETRTYLFDNAENEIEAAVKKSNSKKRSSKISTDHISNKLEWERQISVNERIRKLTNK